MNKLDAEVIFPSEGTQTLARTVPNFAATVLFK